MKNLYITICNNALDHGKDRESYISELVEGKTLEHYFAAEYLGDEWQIYYTSAVNDYSKFLDCEEVGNISPCDGDGVMITRIVLGGDSDGKNILSTVASIALMYFSAGVGAAVAGTSLSAATGAAAFWGYTAAIGVQLAGGYLLNYLAGSNTEQAKDESTTYGWGEIASTQGEGNVIPIVFGTVRTGGQLLAAFVDYNGQKQYLNLLYAICEGPVDHAGNGEDDNCTGINTDKILINGNPIANYSDVVLYKRAGLNNQSVIPNFNDTKIDKSVAAELELAGAWVTSTTDGGAVDGLQVVIECPALYAVGKNGKRYNNSVGIEIEYKLNADSVWTDYAVSYKSEAVYAHDFVNEWVLTAGDQTSTFSVGNTVTLYYSGGTTTRVISSAEYNTTDLNYYTKIIFTAIPPASTYAIEVSTNTISVSGNSNNAVRGIYRIDNLSQGKYDVRCRCVSKGSTANGSVSGVYYKTLTSISYDDFARPNVALVGIRTLASDQLNGGMPQVTFEVSRSQGWVYNPYTTSYVEKDVTTPAWAAYDMISRVKKYYNINTTNTDIVVEGIAVNRMDYDALSEAATYHEEMVDGRKRCQCNYILDSVKQLGEALKDIESVGRFKIIRRATKYSCVVDKPVTVPVQLFTEANTIADSFTESFQSIGKRANAIEVRFRDAEMDYNWNTCPVTTSDYDDASSVENPIQITLNACTNWNYAYIEGAYQLRQNQLLRRTISHSHNIDAIRLQFGDVYYYQSSVTDWGQGGRIVAADANTITLDKQVLLQTGKTYDIIIRLANDSIITKTVSNMVDTALFGMALDIDQTDIYTNRLIVTTPFTADYHTPTKTGTNTFTVTGNQTAIYTNGLEVELDYGYNFTMTAIVQTSSYGSVTTVTINKTVPDSVYLVRYAYTMPKVDDVYSFGETSIAAKPFRCIGIRRNGDLTCEVTGIEYVAGVYDETINIPTPDYTPAASFTDATINSHVDESGVPVLDIAWTPPQSYNGARIEVNGKTAANVGMFDYAVSIPQEATGLYNIKITVIDLFGNDVGSVLKQYELTLNAPPPQLTDLTISPIVKGFAISFNL